MEEKSPIDQLVCHNVDSVEYVKGEDNYDLRCTCGKYSRVDGLTLHIVLEKEKRDKRRSRPRR